MGPKPTALTVKPGPIPSALKAREQWIVWRYVWKEDRGKWTKPPCQTNGRLASATDPATWTRFDTARWAYEEGGWDGIGFVVTKADPFVGIDFDHVIDIASNTPPSERVIEAVRDLASYSEWSPSGQGIRVFCRGKLPKMWLVRPWIELYDDQRFFTVTGHRLHGAPEQPVEAQEALDSIVAMIAPEEIERVAPVHTRIDRPMLVTLSDLDIVAMCRRAKNGYSFSRLYDHGEIGAYDGDRSRADMALAGMIAFYTSDEDQIDRIVRRSALNRDKWMDRPDYRRRTISKVEGGEKWAPSERYARNSNAASRLATALAKRSSALNTSPVAGTASRSDSGEPKTASDTSP